MPFQLIYSSAANGDMPRHELEKILAQARARNRSLDVTGLLVYVDGVFLQILEGEREAVSKLMEKIAHDPRHRDVKGFREADTEHRSFASWQMAFVSPSAREFAAWAGLEGATTVEATLAALQSDLDRVPRIVVSLLGALSEA
ncbi:MAG: BLUF domain-containing protein [Pseudomonadota bacterium]|nr:BLUF domain-containing protein [Pseudomonadota bacterium]